MSVKTMFIYILGRSIEASATARNALGFARLSLFPNKDLILSHLGIKRDNGKLCDFCQLVQFREECGEHPIIYRSALIDTNCDLCVATNALTRVNARITLVQTTRRTALVRPLRSLNKVTKHLAPVNASGDTVHNVTTHAGRDATPIACFFSFLGCLLDGIL